MKKILFKNFIWFAVLTVISLGCKEEPILPVIDLTNGEFISAEFTNAGTGTTVLTFEEANNEFEKLEWTDSEYGVSVPVKYTIELSGSSTFDNTFELGQTSATNLSVKVSEINNAVLALGITPFEANDVYFRILSNVVGTDQIPVLTSGSISRNVTAYVTEFASIYMIGDALLGWDTNTPVEVYGVGPNYYEVIAEFNNGGAFRFFETPSWNANWYNWTYFEGGTVDANFESAADGDTNLRFIGATGYYKLTVNLVTKEITMLGVEKPTMYLVGAGVPGSGWNWDDPTVEMTWLKDGHWEVTTDFINEAFRFFPVFNDWGSGRNYPYFVTEEYDIDPLFEDAQDGDNNFYFNGEPGTYKLILNEIDKTIVMANAGTAGPPKYLVGAATPAGWGWDNPVEAIQYEAGVYTAELYFTNEAFRFFDSQGDWGSGTNYPFYVGEGYTIDANFEDALDGDNNFRFIGKEGNYILILDTNNKTIELKGGSGDPLYIVGSGVPDAGWGWDTPIEVLQINTGVFVATTQFIGGGENAFRFFTAYGDWGSGLNYPYYSDAGYTIDANLANAADGDSNFKFTGTDGVYTITIDDNAKTITLEQ